MGSTIFALTGLSIYDDGPDRYEGDPCTQQLVQGCQMQPQANLRLAKSGKARGRHRTPASPQQHFPYTFSRVYVGAAHPC